MIKLLRREFSENEYRALSEEINTINGERLLFLSGVGGLTSGVAYVISISDELLKGSSLLYLAMAIFAVIICFLSNYLLKYNKPAILSTAYIFLTIEMIMYIYNGTLLYKTSNATMICVLIVSVPVFFIERQERLLIFLTMMTLLFCGTSYAVKEVSLARIDCINCVLSLCGGIIVGRFSTYTKVSELLKKRKLEAECEIDDLTKVKNRNAAKRWVDGYLSKSYDPCVMMIIDIDNFKIQNNTFGHISGDEILIKIGDILKSLFDDNHCICRLNGDMFMVFVTDIYDMEIVNYMAESLIAAAGNIRIDDTRTERLSLSIGIAVRSISINTYEELYHYADEALLRAKEKGKGKYEFYN